ncbi:MAG: LuxR C-terminal-related transcriptional regulator [Pyrinomonadaceae bacterium]
MLKREIKQLIDRTADPAFAVNGLHSIEFWNKAAEDFFGIESKDAIGKSCSSIVQGDDECGQFCSKDCAIFHAAEKHNPIQNFDLKILTSNGKKWCNVSVLIAEENKSVLPYTIHIVRNIDVRKRLELLMRNFLVVEADFPPERAVDLISTTRAPSREAILSDRELQILKLLASGQKTNDIAEQLCISRTTVNNHVQHVLKKLSAHSRLEAIRRAEHAGLI